MNRRIGKGPIYPLFELAATATTDTWWSDFLIRCSRGDLPKGVTLNGDIISYTKLDGTAHYQLSSSPESLFRELCTFFATHIRMSPDDTKSTGRSTVRRKTEGWKGLKRKHMRAALLQLFVQQYQNLNNLNEEQMSELTDVMYRANLYGLLNDSVEMMGGIVSSIRCIEYDGEHFHLVGTPNKRRIRIPPPPDPMLKRYPTKKVDLGKVCVASLVLLKRRLDGRLVRALPIAG